LQPLTVLPCGMKQVGLLLSDRADHLLKAEVNGHTERSQRGAELMGDGSHKIVLQFVKPPGSSNILENDSGPYDPPLWFVHRGCPWQEVAVALRRRHLYCFLEAFGDVRSLAA